MISDPAEYGLSNVTDPACPACGFGIPEPDAADSIVPNPEDYLYWDTVHFTTVAHKIFGDAAADAVEAAVFAPHGAAAAVPEPATALLLALAAPLVCYRRR